MLTVCLCVRAGPAALITIGLTAIITVGLTAYAHCDSRCWNKLHVHRMTPGAGFPGHISGQIPKPYSLELPAH